MRNQAVLEAELAARETPGAVPAGPAGAPDDAARRCRPEERTHTAELITDAHAAATAFLASVHPAGPGRYGQPGIPA